MRFPTHARGSTTPGPRPRLPLFGVAGALIAFGLIVAVPPLGIRPALAEPNSGSPSVVEQSKEDQAANRGWLGVRIQSIDADTAAALGLPDAKGALVSEVTADSPAAVSGLKEDDAIIAVNGDMIADGKDLARKIANQDPDTTVDLKIWRADGEHSVKVKLGKFPSSAEQIDDLDGSGSAIEPNGMNSGRLGLKLTSAKMIEGGAGVAIAEVDPESDAAQKGLRSGDIILRVDRKPVSSPEQAVELVKAVRDKGLKAVLLVVKSGEETRSVPVRFSEKLAKQG